MNAVLRDYQWCYSPVSQLTGMKGRNVGLGLVVRHMSLCTLASGGCGAGALVTRLSVWSDHHWLELALSGLAINNYQ